MRTTRWYLFYVEGSALIVCVGLLVLTAVSRDWIEVIFRVDPDRGSGAAEWGAALVVAVIGLASAVAARVEWRRGRQPTTALPIPRR